MTHVNDDQLLLLTYGELSGPELAEVERHLRTCQVCRAALERLDRARVALDWSQPVRMARRRLRWVAGGLAAAATVAALLLLRSGTAPERGWTPPTVWSPNAGYIAGGVDAVQIDAQLTRLEQERSYGLPD